MGPRNSLFALLVVATLVCGGRAQAQTWGDAPQSYQSSTDSLDDLRGQVGLDLSFFSDSDASGDLFIASPLLWGWYAAGEHVGLSLDWGLAYADVSISASSFSDSELRAGNPFLGVFYLDRTSTSELRVGGGVALPIASAPDNPIAAVALLGTTSSRGSWSMWLWLPETLTMAGIVGYETVVAEHLLLGTEGALAVLVPTADGDRRDTEVLAQFAGEVGYAAGLVRASVALRGVWVVSNDSPGADNFQASIEPRVTLDFGGGFVRAGLSMNLDEPGGFAFDDGGFWAVTLGGGVNLR